MFTQYLNLTPGFFLGANVRGQAIKKNRVGLRFCIKEIIFFDRNENYISNKIIYPNSDSLSFKLLKIFKLEIFPLTYAPPVISFPIFKKIRILNIK